MFKKEVFLLAVLFPATVFAVTIDELREATSKHYTSIKQIHVVYVMEDNDYGQTRTLTPEAIELFKKTGQSQSMIDVFKSADRINSSRKEKIELFYDIETKDMKEIITDLRDIPKLLKDNNLPAKEKRNVCQTKIILTDRNHSLRFRPVESYHEDRESLTLEKNERNGLVIPEIMLLGIIPSYYLTDAHNPTLFKQEDGKLKIEITSGKQKEYKSLILCDPSLDYRVSLIQQYKEGNLTKETIITDYRIIGGIPFPFHCIEKSFDKDGNILTEKIYTIENVELNQKFAPDTFKVTIPDGTQFTDFAISEVVYELDEGGFWSMKDLLAVVARNAEKFKNPTESNCSQSNP